MDNKQQQRQKPISHLYACRETTVAVMHRPGGGGHGRCEAEGQRKLNDVGHRHYSLGSEHSVLSTIGWDLIRHVQI